MKNGVKMKKSKTRKDEILEKAYHLFFEKGYDATTVRMIMKEVGCEIGLFYYYFENKDDVFQQVLDCFFEHYKKDFAQLADSAKRDPFRALNRFFEYMILETEKFRGKYTENLHRTIRWSIREQTLTIIVPYLREIIEALIAYGAKPALSSDVLSVMLAHGVGSFILHEESQRFVSVKSEVQKGVNLLMGLNPEHADLMFPSEAQSGDKDAMMKLLLKHMDCFPGMKKEELADVLEQKISKEEILAIWHQGTVVGCIAFSKKDKSIDFFVTADAYEHRGIGTRLFVTAMAQFPLGETITVIIYDTEAVLRFVQGFGFEMETECAINERKCRKMNLCLSERMLRTQERIKE